MIGLTAHRKLKPLLTPLEPRGGFARPSSRTWLAPPAAPIQEGMALPAACMLVSAAAAGCASAWRPRTGTR